VANKSPGRPTKYTPILAERICALVSQGESKKSISDKDDFPARSTIDLWLHEHKGFSDMYARACESRAEKFAEEIVEIADRTDLDPNDKRVRVDARKWVAAKLLPRKYGEAMTLKGDKENPLLVKAVDLPDSALLAIAAGERALDG